MNRERFLERVRHALHRRPGQPAEKPPELLEPLLDWNPAELVEAFARELELVGGKAHQVIDIEEARAKLRELLEELGAKSFIRNGDNVVDEVLDAIRVPQAENPADADVGITGALYGLANTGTLVLTSELGRRGSLLPMTHIALLRIEQLVPSMAEALDRHHQQMPSAWVQATGPSRTADIELTLSTGVHGPGVVHVILIG